MVMEHIFVPISVTNLQLLIIVTVARGTFAVLLSSMEHKLSVTAFAKPDTAQKMYK